MFHDTDHSTYHCQRAAAERDAADRAASEQARAIHLELADRHAAATAKHHTLRMVQGG